MKRFVVLLAVLVLCDQARAETFRLDRKPDAFFLETLGPLQYRFDFREESSMDLLLDVDWEAPSMTYGSLKLNFPGCSVEREIQKTAGPGLIETVVMELEFDPFELCAVPSAEIPLVPMTQGIFHISDMFDFQFTEDPVLTGSYTLSGPGETVEGEFAVEFWRTPHGEKFHQIDSNGHPRSVRLLDQTAGVWWPEGDSTLFDETVDSHRIKIGVRQAAYYLENAQLTLIPEPPSLALLLALLLGALLPACLLILVWRGKRR